MYQGQYYDEEIELAYNRFRYYSPETGTYISQDPIGLEGGLTFYGYVEDPNSYLDIFGLKKSYHANDRRNSKKQHGYEIYDRHGNVVKTGVSSGRIRKKDKKSSRAEKQVRDLNSDPVNHPDGPYSSKVKAVVPSQDGARGMIYDWEQSNTNQHASTLDPDIHKLPTPK
jgi:RHS repeat-associated protein